MDNLDDITKKYKDEIVNLYKNQENEYVPDFSDDETISENDEPSENGEKIPDDMIMPPAVTEPLKVYNSEDEEYKGSGYLIVEVKSGSGAYPVENALVIVTRNINGEDKILSIMRTNQNGKTEIMELPAPANNGTKISDKNPYAFYNVIVYMESYYEVQNRNVSVFSGITSLLPVNLIPLPAYTHENKVMTFYEQEPDL